MAQNLLYVLKYSLWKEAIHVLFVDKALRKDYDNDFVQR